MRHLVAAPRTRHPIPPTEEWINSSSIRPQMPQVHASLGIPGYRTHCERDGPCCFKGRRCRFSQMQSIIRPVALSSTKNELHRMCGGAGDCSGARCVVCWLCPKPSSPKPTSSAWGAMSRIYRRDGFRERFRPMQGPRGHFSKSLSNPKVLPEGDAPPAVPEGLLQMNSNMFCFSLCNTQHDVVHRSHPRNKQRQTGNTREMSDQKRNEKDIVKNKA